MSTESTLDSSAVALNVQEISKRVLTLIENIRSRQDISPETIAKYTGLQVWFDPEKTYKYGVTGKLTEEWLYTLESMSPETPGDKPSSLLFDIDTGTDTPPPVCVALNDYSTPLIASGFTAQQFRARPNAQDFWIFSRGAIKVTVYLRGLSGPTDARACVSMLIISANA